MTTVLPSGPPTLVTPPPEIEAFPTKAATNLPLTPSSATQMHFPTQEKHKVDCLPQDFARPSPSSTTLPQNNDPQFVAMASRLASYYETRSQAIANYQHQQCQAWAQTHRRRCQAVTGAAMLVVAWYVRDRIQRRRRRRKTAFRNALDQRNTKTRKISRGEVVKRWVMQVPEKPIPPNVLMLEKPRDESEANFSLDADPPQDRDDQLYEMADNMIKSQHGKIDTPIFGALNFDESESEDGSKQEEEGRDEQEDEDEDEDDDMEFDDDDLDDEDFEEDSSYEGHSRKSGPVNEKS